MSYCLEAVPLKLDVDEDEDLATFSPPPFPSPCEK